MSQKSGFASRLLWMIGQQVLGTPCDANCHFETDSEIERPFRIVQVGDAQRRDGTGTVALWLSLR